MELITRLEPSNEKVYCLRHGFATTLSCKQNCFCGKFETNFVTTLKLIFITRYHYCHRQMFYFQNSLRVLNVKTGKI